MTARTALALALTLGGATAAAQERDEARFNRRHQWRLEARISTVYYPEIDHGLNAVTVNNPGPVLNDGPFQAVFGPQHRLLIEGEADRDLYDGFGSFAVGLAGSYAQFDGNGLHNAAVSGAPAFYVTSSDATSFHLAQLRLLAIYRFDYFVPQHIPFIPYAKLGLDWAYYWDTLSNGNVTANASGTGSGGQGLITGVEASLGVSFLLDIVDPVIAREMYSDTGIAHTYLSAGYTWQDLENGPSNLLHGLFVGGPRPATLNLSSRFFDFGVTVEF